MDNAAASHSSNAPRRTRSYRNTTRARLAVPNRNEHLSFEHKRRRTDHIGTERRATRDCSNRGPLLSACYCSTGVLLHFFYLGGLSRLLAALAEGLCKMGDKAPTTVKELAKIMQEMSAKLDAIDSLKRSVGEVQESAIHISGFFDEFKAKLDSVCSDLKTLSSNYQLLKAENATLKQELTLIKTDMTELKQYSRANNLEIKGLPVTEKECLETTVQTLGNKLGIEISASDIDIAHRVPTKDKRKSNIVVRFVSRKTRDKVLAMSKKKRLSTANFSFEDDSPVYINEHLCPELKILLGKTIQRRKEKGWKFSWVQNGRILVRKAENSPIVHVASEDNLKLIV